MKNTVSPKATEYILCEEIWRQNTKLTKEEQDKTKKIAKVFDCVDLQKLPKSDFVLRVWWLAEEIFKSGRQDIEKMAQELLEREYGKKIARQALNLNLNVM